MPEHQFITFPESQNHTPADLYTAMQAVPRSTLYICSPVTTRMGLGREYEQADIRTVKEANFRLTHTHLQGLQQVFPLDTQSLLLPGMLGERKTHDRLWDEVEYNTLLFLIWLGISPQSASDFADCVLLTQDEREKMSVYTDGPEQRKRYYEVFQSKIVNAATTLGYDAMPMLVLPRWELSLGCTLEVEIARELNIPVQFVHIEGGLYRTVDRT